MDMLSVVEAQRAILAAIKALDTEPIDLLAALGRVLAKDVVSDIDLPPFDNSSMDGYALHAQDVSAATPDRPMRLPVVADIPAGHPSPIELDTGHGGPHHDGGDVAARRGCHRAGGRYG